MDASSAAWQGGDLPSYLEAARLASTIPFPPGDEVCAVLLDSLTGFERMIAGDPGAGVPRLEKLVELGAMVEEPRHVIWANFGAAWIGDGRSVQQLLERAVALSRRRGELGTLAEALAMRAGDLVLSQRYDVATEAAEESIALARELDADNLLLLPLSVLAMASAVQGREEEALRHSNEVIDRAAAKGFVLRASSAVYALALAELGCARWENALERLNSLLKAEAASLDPLVPLALPDKIEAAVRAARPDEATDALSALEGWVGSTRDPRAQARLAACRALLAEGAEADHHYEEALELSSHLGPFDLARIRLLYGEHLRRNRRRTDARTQLRPALDGFERMRAEPWAERVRLELRATGESTRRRDASTIDQLTPQEIQISRYVAEGMSNKEIAAQLFLSPRTIDSHLRNVFAKLGITSRMQLARVPLGDELPTPTPV